MLLFIIHSMNFDNAKSSPEHNLKKTVLNKESSYQNRLFIFTDFLFFQRFDMLAFKHDLACDDHCNKGECAAQKHIA